MARAKKRADGRYQKSIMITGINGVKKRKAVYARTLRDLDAKVAAAVEQAKSAQNRPSMLVKDWAKQWVETYKAHREYNTRKMYELILKKYILPTFGDMLLSEVQELHIQSLLNRLTGQGHNYMAQKVFCTLRQLLETARKNKLVKENVMIDMELPIYEQSEKRALTKQEIAIIKRTLMPNKSRIFVLLLLNTGLRRGEALALKPGDINFSEKCVTVNKSVYFESNNPKCKTAKTRAGQRSVPISNDLIPALERYIKSLHGDVLFPSEEGALMRQSDYRYFWDSISAALRAAGLEADDVTPHIFRHTFASTLFWRGVKIKDAQYVLGHASMKTTADLYAHFDPAAKENVRELLNTV